MKFRDIPQVARPGYSVDYDIYDLPRVMEKYRGYPYPLNMEPDFQRIHVWTLNQQSRYMEFLLQGGNSSRDIHFNCPGWMGNDEHGPFELVDGKQRIGACLGFLKGSVSIFDGLYVGDFSDKPLYINGTLKFHINNLKTRKEVLQWYLDINSGGVVHTNEELAKVRKLLLKEKASTAKPI